MMNLDTKLLLFVFIFPFYFSFPIDAKAGYTRGYFVEKKIPDEEERRYFFERNSIAIEYAMESDIVKELTLEAVIALSGDALGISDATTIALKIRKEVKRVMYAKDKGITPKWVANVLVDSTELVLGAAYGKPMKLFLAGSKLSTAIVTAYIYGFCCGPRLSSVQHHEPIMVLHASRRS